MDQAGERATIEQLRQRLQTLVANLHQFRAEFADPNPEKLPSWDNIHTHQRGVVNLLKSLHELLGSEERAAFLESAHLHPTGKFPWDQENVLGTLLRKRLEPDIITWASEGRETGASLEADKLDYEELWDWAAVTAIGIGRDVIPPTTKDSMDTAEDRTKPIDPPPVNMQEMMRFSATGKKAR